MATAKTRQKILDTFFELLKEHSYDEIRPTQLAEAAGVKLSVVRECYASKISLIEAFADKIDMAVLDEQTDDMQDQPARDRLFDVLMTRIDHLSPYKDAIRSLMQAVRDDPLLALEFNRIAVRSQRWMLEAADIKMNGFKGHAAAQGLAIAFARVLETWLDEPDAGMPKTMARLDSELDRGEDWMKRIERLDGMTRRVQKLGSMFRRSRKRSEETWQADDRTEPMADGVAEAG